MVKAGNGEGMVFANNIVRALLSGCSQVAISQVVKGQTLVSRYSGASENRQGETWNCCKRTQREGAANPSRHVIR